jgi:hypothetical protein
VPDYTSLATEINAIKSEIAASVAASTYTAQDLVYLASALETLGGMLGVTDIVGATADKITQINTTTTTSLASIESARSSSVADVNLERTSALGAITTLKDSAMNQIAGASANFNVLFIGSMM